MNETSIKIKPTDTYNNKKFCQKANIIFLIFYNLEIIKNYKYILSFWVENV